MSSATRNVIIAVGATISWALLVQFAVSGEFDDGSVFGTTSLLVCGLLIAAPALTFAPLARWTRAPFFAFEAVAGWAALGSLVIFVSPSDPPTLVHFLAFLLALTIALASVFTVLAFVIGLRVFKCRPGERDVVRARREGYLAAIVVVALGLLHGAGTLSPASAALLLLAAGLGEGFALARGGDQTERRAARSP